MILSIDLIHSNHFQHSSQVLLASDITPAWSEAYEAILNGLSERYVTFWGAVDWMTQFGHDEDNRESYPEQFKGRLIPEALFGRYDMPGWVGNGVTRSSMDTTRDVDRDPISADAMLFYKGWLTLVLGIRQRVCANVLPLTWTSLDKTKSSTTTWNYDSVSRKLASQFNSNDGAGMN